MQEISKKIVKKEAREALIFVVSNSLLQLGNLVVIPLFFFWLKPEDFGIIAITEIIGSFLVIILGLSLEESINKFYYEWSEEERKRGIGAIWMSSWISSLLIGIMSIFFLSMVSKYIFKKVDFYPYIFLGLIGTILTSLARITFTTIRIKRLPMLYAGWSLSAFTLLLSLRVFFVFINKEGLMGYYKANIIAASIIVLISVIIMLHFSKLCLRNSGLKKSLQFSLPIIPSSIISALTNIGDRLILQNYVSLSSLGIYALSLKFASIITALHDGIKLSYGPFVWKTINKEKDSKNLITQIAPVFIAPIFFLSLVVSLFSSDIIFLINSPSYFAVAELVPAVVGFTLINCLYLYFTPGIMLGGRTDLLWIPSSGKLLAVLSGVFIVQQLNIAGIIISRYFSALIYFGISFYFSQKVFYMPHRINKLVMLGLCYTSCICVFLFFDMDHRLITLLEKIFLSSLFATLTFLILNPNNRFFNFKNVFYKFFNQFLLKKKKKF